MELLPFQEALALLCHVIKQTEDLTWLKDGERRYGITLFAIGHEVVHVGGAGRPAERLPKGVRLKNKGSKKQSGRKRPKYEAP